VLGWNLRRDTVSTEVFRDFPYSLQTYRRA
jgi:hypothetical protein